MTAGPFWITKLSPLVVRDYGIMRAPYAESMVEDTSSLHPRGDPFSTDVFGLQWKPNGIKIRLSYRELVANDLDFGQFSR
jgi:hypothetical protein